jgi:predicted nucleotidyltransferase
MVNLYKSEFTLLQQEILRFLFMKAGMSFNARRLSKPLNRTPAGIVKALPELEKEELIKINKDSDSGRWSIELNTENRKVLALKRIRNLGMIYESGLAKFLEDSFPGCTIILFGSYSRGEDIWFGKDDDRNSDIDIAIIGTKKKDVDLDIFERMLEREIIINFYESWGNIHKDLKNNILNGIVISGSVDL